MQKKNRTKPRKQSLGKQKGPPPAAAKQKSKRTLPGKKAPPSTPAEQRAKDFIDMTVPGVIKFMADHFLCGNTYRSVWALREYPTSTDEMAILRHLGEKGGVTLHIYTRPVSAVEEKNLLINATNKNIMNTGSANNLKESIAAEDNIKKMKSLVSTMRERNESLLHCAVFIELMAADMDELKLLQTEVATELVRSKLNVDKLMLRQREGFLCVMPGGWNVFGVQFERAMPASSVANLYPLNYSGKTDTHGFFIGRDKFGSNILVDFDKRDDDKTNANALILGNSGQGKSYLMKLLLCNFLESGKAVACLDPEAEYADIAENLGGCYIDMMSGQYLINPLEPKCWESAMPTESEIANEDGKTPPAFTKHSKLSQHISFLKDFFRTYKDFSDKHIDVIELLLGKTYAQFGISDNTDFSRLSPMDYPILSDLYNLIESEFEGYDSSGSRLYTKETLQEILLGLHSMCKGAESAFFDGHTNISSSRFLVFGVKGLLQASKNIRNALLFNILSYLSDKLLTEGNTVASLDELYLCEATRWCI